MGNSRRFFITNGGTIVNNYTIVSSGSSMGTGSGTSYALSNAKEVTIYSGVYLWLRITISTTVEGGPCGSIILAKHADTGVVDILHQAWKLPSVIDDDVTTYQHLGTTKPRVVSKERATFNFDWSNDKKLILMLVDPGDQYSGGYTVNVSTSM